ncbi:SH3 domain-containing C40 family peptidase [Alkaliphilus peptidifermentans]|uniref:SH3 domain-containing protein n=1 Tax=Alkaliphilus peptidifermentans DSM 18978 TaxID=1120976 RepID=A0A1G5BLR7_9FIRM|nr:SH3 domain-containing C40 family peptidase [Alkaliphilus peptidifermentans]SCX91115.1 SH3 domain-containing protein [Alkaliphilus peptidifermentans DSM 18978]
MENKTILKGIVKETIAPIKKHPDFESELADEALFGMVVKILRHEKDGWYYIETQYDYQGYIHEKYLHIDKVRAEEWEKNANSCINHAIIDVMAEPKYQSYGIKLLTRGAIVCTTGVTEGEWSQMLMPDDTKGWTKTRFTNRINKWNEKEQEKIIRKKLVETALLYLGTQYRWGGKTPLGIDCSGLCSMVYLLHGKIIHRDSKFNEKYLRKISREEIQAADILFFPKHVALYIGEDKYIHSTSFSGEVVINSLNSHHEDYRDDLANTITGFGSVFKAPPLDL